MRIFYELFKPLLTTRVLDIGGTTNTWTTESSNAAAFAVTLVNLRPVGLALSGRFREVEGDATKLPFANDSFDLVFSNSVIEHMITWEGQQAFAAEARRIARRLWVQTPARSFPLEPHLLAPFFQHLPRALQTRMARNFTLWGLLTRPDPARVDEMLSDIRLLTYREFQKLFPDCRIMKERVLGLTKSYVAVRGCE